MCIRDRDCGTDANKAIKFWVTTLPGYYNLHSMMQSGTVTVSYTHLDVYKRQADCSVSVLIHCQIFVNVGQNSLFEQISLYVSRQVRTKNSF